MNARRGMAGLLIIVGIAIASLLAGAELAQTFKPGHKTDADTLSQAGGQIGGAIAGKPGELVGSNLGYLVALAFGLAAAHRHGAAAAANAKLAVLAPQFVTPAPLRSVAIHSPHQEAAP